MSSFKQILKLARLNESFEKLKEDSAKWAESRMRHASQKVVRTGKISIFKERALPGRIYQFAYDAKHKKTLPYFDSFPYVLVLESKGDSFLGLNLHYLPIWYRAILFDRLKVLARHPDGQPSETSKFLIRYDLIKSVRKYRYHKPALKKYLYTQLRSPLFHIPGNYWNIALFLPTYDFMANGSQIRTKRVHFDSRRTINKGL